jgi:hypothetical protein
MREMTHGFDEFSGAFLFTRELTIYLARHQVLLEAGVTAEVLISH